MKFQKIFAQKFFVWGALGASLAVSMGAQAANINCPSCALQARLDSQKPLQTVLGDQNASNVNLGINVAGLVNQGSLLQFPTLAPAASTNSTVFTGQGELPNAFVRPWELPKSNFDPSFVTDYYTSAKGPINIPSAPWNLFLPPSIAQSYYEMAMAQMGPMPGPVSLVSNLGDAPLDLSPNALVAPAPQQAPSLPARASAQISAVTLAPSAGPTLARTLSVSPVRF